MTATSNPAAFAAVPAPGPLFNRTLPNGGESGESETMDSLNLIFIVGLAVVITVLARYLSTRGRRK